MRVLQLGKFYPFSGGIERVMYDLADGLSERNIRCDILCASVVGKGNLDITVTANSYVKIMSTIISPSMIFELKRIMHNYDIIHIHHPDPMAALALFLSGFTGPVILHWHSDIIKQKKMLLFYSILQNWLLKRSKLVVTTSPLYLDGSPFLRDFKEKCVSVPIGVDKKVDAEDGSDIHLIKKKYSGRKIIYSLGRLIYYKGYEYLIDAASYLDDSYIILIGGGGPMYTLLQEQIKDKGLEEKVKLLGRVADDMMSKYYQACDLFCMSSIERTEAFGIAQIEAMSFGKPIVATKIPGSGVAWVNEDGVTGINVECRDSKGLAMAFKQILSDDALYHKLSLGALVRYQTLFTKKNMIDNVLTIYEKMLR
jgi:glycosyltransferase involved in cell wall biosynthesis